MLLMNHKLSDSKRRFSLLLVFFSILTMCINASSYVSPSEQQDACCPDTEIQIKNCLSCAILVDLEAVTVACDDGSFRMQTASVFIATRSASIPLTLEKRSRISRGPPLLISDFLII